MTGAVRRELDLLIDEAYRDPRRIRELIEASFALGACTRVRPKGGSSNARLAERLRRKAKVVQEYDGRSALLEMADELETGRIKGPMSSSESKEARGQP